MIAQGQAAWGRWVLGLTAEGGGEAVMILF